MKNIFTAFTFIALISAGIFLDSLLVNLVCSLIGVHGAWLVFTQILTWIILATFTGGIVIVLSFLAAGAIYTSTK